MARRTTRPVDWDGLFRRWRGSGLTQAEFCRRQGIPIHSFRTRPEGRARRCNRQIQAA